MTKKTTNRTFRLRAKPGDKPVEFSLQGEATLAAAPAEGKGPRRFSMVAYDGGPMRPAVNPPIPHPVIVDLASLEVPRQRVPALKDHDPKALVGHTDKIIVGTTLTAEGVISGTGEPARDVVQAADNGFVWGVSMGAVFKTMQLIPAGKSVHVNGRTWSGPVFVARNGRLRELSFLTLAADDDTSATIAANAAGTHPMTFAEWLKANGFGPQVKLNKAQVAILNAAFEASKDETTLEAGLKTLLDAQIKAAADLPDEGKPAKGKKKQSRAALARIAAAASGALDDDGDDDDDDDDEEEDPALVLRQLNARLESFERRQEIRELCGTKHTTIAATALAKNWDNETITQAIRAAELEAKLPRSTRAHMGSDRKAGKLMAATIEAALCLSLGIAEKTVAETYPTSEREAVMNAAMTSEMRGFSLHALMDNVLFAAGEHYSGSRKSNDFIRTVLQAESSLQASGFSTLSLSGILSNVANKGLIASYSAVEVVWPQICGVRNHSDFKVHTRYRLDSTGAFKKVGPDGELKHIGMTDASYTNQVATFGAIIALTRQMMVNDDLGAFMEIPNLLGRLAALRIEEAVFTLLLSNPSSFFSAGNGNLITGGATALSIAALTAAELKFKNFVKDGKPILSTPKKLLVGTGLKNTADNLMSEKLVIASGLAATNAKTIEPAKNPHAGKFQVIDSPYVNNTAVKDQDGAAISGQSDTAFWLLADPAVRAAIAVAFLNGQRMPTIESAQTDFNTLGMQWRGFHDFGVGMEEETAAVQSAGA